MMPLTGLLRHCTYDQFDAMSGCALAQRNRDARRPSAPVLIVGVDCQRRTGSTQCQSLGVDVTSLKPQTRRILTCQRNCRWDMTSVNIRVVGEERDPVAVRAGEVASLAIDGELSAGFARVASGGRGHAGGSNSYRAGLATDGCTRRHDGLNARYECCLAKGNRGCGRRRLCVSRRS